MLSGCTSWQAQPVTPEFLSSQLPSKVRVHRVDGSKVVLHDPSFSTDSLVGSMDGTPTGVPLALVRQMDVRHGSAGKTVGLVLGVAAGAVVILYTAAAIVCGGSYSCSEY